MKVLFKIVMAIIALTLIVVGIAWFQLRPPESSLVPNRSGTFTLANVTIVEPGSAHRSHQTIVINGEKIVEVRDATEDERGKPTRFLLPGLIDMHVHQPLTLGGLPEYLALLYLRHGVTSVRYTGHTDSGAEVERHRERIEAGEIPGPRVFSCGPMIDGEPPLWPSSIVVTDPSAAESVVADLAAKGADCIKVYSNLSAPVLRGVVKAARDHDLQVVGHVPVGVALEESGIDDVQHLIGIAMPTVGNGNPMVEGWSTLSADRIADVAEYSIASGISHTPTLVFWWTNAMRDQHERLVNETPANLMPRVFRDVGWRPQEAIRLGGSRTNEMQESLRAAYARAQEVVGILHKRGVRIQAGTDTANPFVVPGAALVKEIGLLSDAGLSNEDALAAATTIPGRALGLASNGMIQPGASADLLLLKSDPVDNLNALDEIDLVVASGRVYTRAYLDEEIARHQKHHGNFTWDQLLPFLANLSR